VDCFSIRNQRSITWGNPHGSAIRPSGRALHLEACKQVHTEACMEACRQYESKQRHAKANPSHTAIGVHLGFSPRESMLQARIGPCSGCLMLCAWAARGTARVLHGVLPGCFKWRGGCMLMQKQVSTVRLLTYLDLSIQVLPRIYLLTSSRPAWATPLGLRSQA
jgi:hypothetical protein